MKVSGKMAKGKDKDSRFGLMGRDTLDNGEVIKPMEMEFCIILTETYTKESGWMIRQVEREFIVTPMVHGTKAFGLKINSTERVRKSGLMDKTTKDSIAKGANTAKDYFVLKTRAIMKVNSFSTKFMGKVFLL